MTVELAVLIENPELVKESSVWKGSVYTESGTIQESYIKALSPAETIAELFCSALGAKIGLPVSSSFVVKDHKGFLSKSGQDVFFGSGAIDAPSFFRFLEKRNTEEYLKTIDLIKQFLDWRDFNSTIVFDAWIANTDRNTENLLVGKNNMFFLIDHAYAFGGNERQSWTQKELKPSIEYQNILLDYLLLMGGDASKDFDKSVPDIVKNFSLCSLDEVWDMCYADYFAKEEWKQKLLCFLSERILYLEVILCKISRGQRWII